MEHLEQENKELKDEIARLTALMEYVIAAQNQSSPSPATPPPQRTIISKIVSSTVHVVAASQPIPAMPAGFPWGITPNLYQKRPDVYEKMDEMKDQFLEMRKELKTLRGEDLFGKSVVELCLVPNVKISMKFKVSDFEKYKGNTCPLSHLVIASIRTFNYLGEAFVKQYKYNMDMAPNRDQLRSMS
ncbi:hypothetical protein KIW84_010476 [Lathyrus oleraceus]|uniref:Uncharacterized protein n=1 Tax=Pisum sativum TaxID=3888 RepID=A0A9D4YPK7_PEA|nr:hypothetical protein KIW84_010476 [Pisum sativum]